MPHLDPERIALAVLGEPVSDAERAHLATCATCSTGQRPRGRDGSDAAFEAPPTAVWAAIAAELRLADHTHPRPPAVRPASRRRWGTRTTVIALAAAVLVVGAAGIGLALARSAAPIATATLRAFPGWAGDHGSAFLDAPTAGRSSIVLHTNLAASATTDHEVWLMTSDLHHLVSLGYLTGPDGTFVVPAGIDVRRYSVVDISDEPRDGNPAHSGDSILRGPLRS